MHYNRNTKEVGKIIYCPYIKFCFQSSNFIGFNISLYHDSENKILYHNKGDDNYN